MRLPGALNTGTSGLMPQQRLSSMTTAVTRTALVHISCTSGPMNLLAVIFVNQWVVFFPPIEQAVLTLLCGRNSC